MDEIRNFLGKSKPMEEDGTSYYIMLETYFFKSSGTPSVSDDTYMHSDHMASHTF